MRFFNIAWFLFVAIVLVSLTACGGSAGLERGISKKVKAVSIPGASPTQGQAPKSVSLFDNGSTPSGGIVKWEWNFNDPNGSPGWHDFTSTQGEATHLYALSGTYQPQLRVTASNGAKDSANVTIVLTGSNQVPQAVISADPTSGVAPLDVSFDASASSDPDGSIVSYQWDFDGDSVWDLDSGSVATADHTYTTSGTYNARVLVTDDNGATDDATVQITVEDAVPEQFPVVVDAGGDVHHTSLAIINGKPAIAYNTYSGYYSHLKYAFSSSATGGSDWLSVTIDSGPGEDFPVGFNPSLAEINGYPAIAYSDGGNGSGALKYAYSTTPDGSGGWNTLTVYASGTEWTPAGSLALVNGIPAIAFGFHEAADVHFLGYAYSSETDGSSGWSTLVVDGVDRAGGVAKLKVIDGQPAIAYQKGGFTPNWTSVYYARSSVPDGSSGWTSNFVTSGRMFHLSLAQVVGKPAFSYYGTSIVDNNLNYAHSSMADGSSGWSLVAADPEEWSGDAGTSLAVISGFPAISYSSSAGILRYAVSSTADGSSGWTTSIVDSTPSSGGTSSLAELADGTAGISYQGGSQDLMFTRVE